MRIRWGVCIGCGVEWIVRWRVLIELVRESPHHPRPWCDRLARADESLEDGSLDQYSGASHLMQLLAEHTLRLGGGRWKRRRPLEIEGNERCWEGRWDGSF